MPDYKKQNYIRSAAILGATMITVKIVGAFFKFPILNILGDEGTTHFQIPYQIYAVLLAISTTGIPVAMARLISSAASRGRMNQVKQLFSVALPAFTAVGFILAVIMYAFADNLAVFMHDRAAALGIRILSPAVVLVCMLSVYEGYSQGLRDMIPTATKQLTEVIGKLIFGFTAVWWLFSHGYETPVMSAGAIIGVPIGLFIALVILIIYHRKAEKTKYNRIQYDAPEGRLKTLAGIMRVSTPVTLGAALMSILTLIDMYVVLDRLHSAAGYTAEAAHVLFGVYAKGQTLFVLPSAFIAPITISIIPAIAACLAQKRQRDAQRITEISLKLSNLLVIPAGLGLSVLSYPIFNAFYWKSNENGPACLMIFGIASYFMCMQLVTSAILHANGHEKVPIFTIPFGGIVQIILDYILVGNPKIGIIGSPVGTLACYFVISVLNYIFILRYVQIKPDLMIIIKPAACSAVMAAAAWSAYALLHKAGEGIIGTERLEIAIYLTGAVIIAIAVYTILIVATKTVTRAEMRYLPKGEKIADILRMK